MCSIYYTLFVESTIFSGILSGSGTSDFVPACSFGSRPRSNRNVAYVEPLILNQMLLRHSGAMSAMIELTVKGK